MARRERLRHNVALIEERDRNERARLAESAFGSSPASIERPGVNSNETVQGIPQSSIKEDKNQQYERSPGNTKSAAFAEKSPWITRPDSDEPQSWTPKALQRGS